MQPKRRVGKQLRGARGVPSWSSSDVWLQSEQAASGRARKRFRIFQQPLVMLCGRFLYSSTSNKNHNPPAVVCVCSSPPVQDIATIATVRNRGKLR